MIPVTNDNQPTQPGTDAGAQRFAPPQRFAPQHDGPFQAPQPSNPDSPRTRFLVNGVVEGISHYGNAIGVPTVGGEVTFRLTTDAPVSHIERERLFRLEEQGWVRAPTAI